MVNRILVYLFFTVCSLNTSIAQTIISGTVIDETNGEALIGANVLIEEGSEGTISDYDGSFDIKTERALPFTLHIEYLGYESQSIQINESQKNIEIKLAESSVTVDVVEVKAARVSEDTKKSPLTIESLDNVAIKEAASSDFYSGLGNLKGVDLTSASLGFKVINTRGFNSTSPVRSLQIIDGVDNQAPGLNFSLGNFLGSSELDVNKMEIIVGASSAFYGPNAFNGVISMQTKDPFFHKGLSAMVKYGERNLLQTALRYADAIKNKNGEEFMAAKFNVEYLRADDWVADNYDPVTDSEENRVFSVEDNPGGHDGVNIYGDESFAGNIYSSLNNTRTGLNRFHRTGYKESDLVDYNTRNLKLSAALHFRLQPSKTYESPEIILASSYGGGTTVYQGDNRFSLRGIKFYQNRIELRKKDSYFFRVYATNETGGKSFDPYFTALLMQEEAKTNEEWSNRYLEWWSGNTRGNVYKRMKELGYPSESEAAQIQWQRDNKDLLDEWHKEAASYADGYSSADQEAIFLPGTARFDSLFNEIVSRPNNHPDGGTRFIDSSALYHAHGEYTIPVSFLDDFKVGANARLYRPNSAGTIFTDSIESISNFEYGFYTGASKKYGDFIINGAIRFDKNENFKGLVSPAASIVWNPDNTNFLRISGSSAIRNPTLSDQYLNLKVGPATLLGNLNGFDSLFTVESFREFRNDNSKPLDAITVDPIKPEQVRTIEVGYRTTIAERLFVDMSAYLNQYTNFIGNKILVKIPFITTYTPGLPPLTLPNITDVSVYRVAANSDQTVVSRGFAAALNYYVGDYYAVSGNYSWNNLVTKDTDPIVPAFNTPEHKFNIGFSGRRIPMMDNKLFFGFNVNYKWIQGFRFEGSPQFTGDIPTYDMVDAQANLNIKDWDTTVKVGASNLLNNKQFQTYGGPRIGRLAYVSVLYNFSKK